METKSLHKRSNAIDRPVTLHAVNANNLFSLLNFSVRLALNESLKSKCS